MDSVVINLVEGVTGGGGGYRKAVIRGGVGGTWPRDRSDARKGLDLVIAHALSLTAGIDIAPERDERFTYEFPFTLGGEAVAGFPYTFPFEF